MAFGRGFDSPQLHQTIVQHHPMHSSQDQRR